MARSRGPQTLTEVAAVNLREAGYGPIRSMTKAAAAVTVGMSLALATEKLGRFPTQVEYTEWARMSERSAQREWALFLKAFPTERSPERLARWFLSEFHGRLDERPPAVFSVAFEAALP
ncbi:MAG TPA: hypothetical protein VG325_00540 [Solirubrobacteraceae bacterium]|nr:hypothetical protein [Solirubrobacteraceae bacterium]